VPSSKQANVRREQVCFWLEENLFNKEPPASSWNFGLKANRLAATKEGYAYQCENERVSVLPAAFGGMSL
jgi:hypothetical protein